MKVAISGGHLTPALALIDYLQAQHPEVEVVFIGRKFSQDTLAQLSHEAQEIQQRQLPFTAFQAPRINSDSLLTIVLNIPAFGLATLKSLRILIRNRPSVFMSFGGYLALPLAIASFILKIPVVTHEQTPAAGMANQLIGRLAKKIALASSASARYFPAKKVVVTGNPLRLTLFTTQAKPAWILTAPSKPILYITGGNQGSEVLNTITQQSLRQLLNTWFVIHQCGNPTQRRNYKLEMEESCQRLPSALRGNYHVKEWISDSELGWIYQHASVVVSRAGANTVAELVAHRLPAILVPLPFARHDEQTLNAQYMVELGGAEIITQKELNTMSLLKTLGLVKKYHKTMSDQLAKVPNPIDASQKLYEVLLSVAS